MRAELTELREEVESLRAEVNTLDQVTPLPVRCTALCALLLRFTTSWCLHCLFFFFFFVLGAVQSQEGRASALRHQELLDENSAMNDEIVLLREEIQDLLQEMKEVVWVQLSPKIL